MSPAWALVCALSPVQGGDPADDAPPSPAPPSDAREPRHAPPPPEPRAHTSFEPLDPVPVAALQCAAGCGVLALAIPASLFCFLPACVGGPFLLGYFETWVGDTLGGQRAPAIALIGSAYGGVIAAALLGATLYVGAAFVGVPDDVAAPLAVSAGGALVLVTVAALPFVYAITATPKHALDDGSDPPDFFAPRVPLEARKRPRAPRDAPGAHANTVSP